MDIGQGDVELWRENRYRTGRCRTKEKGGYRTGRCRTKEKDGYRTGRCTTKEKDEYWTGRCTGDIVPGRCRTVERE